MEFLTYSGEMPPGCPEGVWSELCRTGLPSVRVNIFTPAKRPVLISAGSEGTQADGILLGYSRENVELYLEFRSGNVLLLWPQEEGRAVVNTSLSAFRESLVQVDARYPFYPKDRDLDMAQDAEEALRRILTEIDGAATADPDGYWSSFLEDVAVGDYAATAL